tara:strand:- start:377 stop:715 length:339 start_codon:yes stop_codon:yes gene_type:complete
MDWDLKQLDVYNLDSSKMETHDKLITIKEAEQIFDKRCPSCDQQTGISAAMINKAVKMGYISGYNQYGGQRTKPKEKIYVIFDELKTFVEKQKRIKARRQWYDDGETGKADS